MTPAARRLRNTPSTTSSFAPGTNVAVLNMMLYYIIKENLVDKDFVANRTEGFDEFCEGILNNIDAAQLARAAAP